MSAINPLSNAIDIARTIARQALSQLPQQAAPAQQQPVSTLLQSYRPEPAWHPQVAPQALQAGSTGSCGPANSSYGPDGFSAWVEGQQPRELDVDLMRMSHAAYGDEVDLCGWTQVSHEQLISEHGWDPEVRLDVPESQFSASVFTDGEGNYVLAYRGTADGAADWITNFEQGAGLETTSGEFELLAPQVAQQFAQALGEGHPPGNLAITGHSQGGGLAAVGSLVTGIPAVTFDASGIHPDTFDRLGLDIDAARESAGDGQIRRYSLYEDALTQLQENIPGASLLVPDAIGHQIVLKPEGELEDGMIDRALEHPAVPDWVTPELARTPGVEQLVRALISHDQQFMIDTMLQQQPWEAGWSPPDAPGGARLNDLVPQSVQDDYQRNIADVAGDVQEVIGSQFANGDYVEGAIRIVGDVGEGFLNSVGDTVDGFAGELAGGLRDQAGQWADSLQGQGPWGVGTLGSVVIQGLGDGGATLLENTGAAFEWASDQAGELFETVADLGGSGAQKAVDGFVTTVRTIGDGVEYAADAVASGASQALEKARDGWDTVTGTVSVAWESATSAASSAWDATTDAVSSAWDSTVHAASDAWSSATDAAGTAWETTVDAISDGASWLNDRMPWNW